MNDLANFCKALAKNGDLSELDRATGVVWFLTEMKSEYDCTLDEITQIFHDNKFTKPNSSRLKKKLKGSAKTVKGNRQDSFRIASKFHDDVNAQYRQFLKTKEVPESNTIIIMEWVKESKRNYLVCMARQINASYELGLYDATAVLTRRMMESLIIEIYASEKREKEIQTKDSNFLGLETLIGKVKPDFSLSKNMLKYMNYIKDIGDTAAHHRTYITKAEDIDEKVIRKTIHELMVKAKLTT